MGPAGERRAAPHHRRAHGSRDESEFQRLGVFAAQAGGSLVTDGKATANSAQMVQGLTYVKSLLANGSMKFAADVGAGDGTEALGTGKAAMTIEGNWIVGGVASSYPDLQYKVVKLPAGPAGPATFILHELLGHRRGSKNQAAAKQLVEAMTSSDQQLTFAKAFGVMPSVQSAADGFRQQFRRRPRSSTRLPTPRPCPTRRASPTSSPT